MASAANDVATAVRLALTPRRTAPLRRSPSRISNFPTARQREFHRSVSAAAASATVSVSQRSVFYAPRSPSTFRIHRRIRVAALDLMVASSSRRERLREVATREFYLFAGWHRGWLRAARNSARHSFAANSERVRRTFERRPPRRAAPGRSPSSFFIAGADL